MTAGNPDLGQDPAQPLLGVHNRLAPVASLGEASRAVCRSIAEHEVGGGNWAGGQVLDGCGQQVAYVSYNGRVWLPARRAAAASRASGWRSGSGSMMKAPYIPLWMCRFSGRAWQW